MIKITYFDRVTKPNNPHSCSIDQLFEVIKRGGKDGSVRRYVEEIRRYPDDKDTRRILKQKNLQCITWQGKFMQRNGHADNSLTGLMCIDFDNVSPSCMMPMKIALMQIPWVMAVFLGPSGNGYKVVILTDNFDPNIYTNCYKQVIAWFIQHLGITPDESCQDVSRCCYVSYDPDIYVNLDAEVFHCEYNPNFDDKEKNSSVTHHKVANKVQPPSQINQIIQYVNRAANSQGGNLSDKQLLEILDLKFKRYPINYQDGHRTRSIFAQAVKLCLVGIPEWMALSYLKDQFLPTGYDERKLNYEASQAYKKNAHKAGSERSTYLDYYHYKQQKKG